MHPLHPRAGDAVFLPHGSAQRRFMAFPARQAGKTAACKDSGGTSPCIYPLYRRLLGAVRHPRLPRKCLRPHPLPQLLRGVTAPRRAAVRRQFLRLFPREYGMGRAGVPARLELSARHALPVPEHLCLLLLEIRFRRCVYHLCAPQLCGKMVRRAHLRRRPIVLRGGVSVPRCGGDRPRRLCGPVPVCGTRQGGERGADIRLPLGI